MSPTFYVQTHVLVTHRMHWLPLADRMIVMKDGLSCLSLCLSVSGWLAVCLSDPLFRCVTIVLSLQTRVLTGDRDEGRPVFLSVCLSLAGWLAVCLLLLFIRR